MGSADWMPRNLDKRVEILFPVEDETLKEEIIHILDVQFADNVKARVMQSDGTYIIPAHKIGKQWKFKCSELDVWVKSGKSAIE